MSLHLAEAASREAAAASRRSSVNWLNSLLGREDDDDVAPYV